MSCKILLTLTAACCLLSISPLYSLSHNSPSTSSGLYLAIFAHAKPIQVVRTNNEHAESAFNKETNQIVQSTTDKTGEQAESERYAKHNLAYDAILHSESQLPVFWNAHHSPSSKDKPKQTKNAEKSLSKPNQVRNTHGKDRIPTMKSLLASMVGNHASTTSSPPSIASSMKTVTKSDPLRKPALCAKTQELAQKQKEPEKVVSSIQPNARGQTTFKPKKKNAAEALAMMAGAIGEGASAFGTAEAICDDSESDNFIKQAMHQLTHEGHPVPQSDESRSASDALSGSENDSSILNRKSAVLVHQRDVAQEEQVPKHEQDQVESAFEESEPTFLFEEDLEEEGILKSPTNVMVGPSLDDQDSYLFEDQDRPHNSYFQDWIQYMDRKGAAALTIVLATLVRLDPSTWTGPQVAIAFTFATFLAFVLLALYISYKMHHRRERLKNGDTSSSSSLGFFHYLTRGVFASHRHQRHTFAALSPFSKETSTYFTLPTYRDTKSPNVAPEPSYATTSASVAGANRSEIRRTSVARQLSITQAQAVQHAQSSI